MADKVIQEINVSFVRTSEELHDLFYEQLGFPSYYGMNWNAFWDCITSPDQSEMPKTLIIKGMDVIAKILPDDASMLFGAIDEYLDTFPDRDIFWSKRTCACCGFMTIDDPYPNSYEICPLCGWEDDQWQNENPGNAGGANRISLYQVRQKFKSHLKPDERFQNYSIEPWILSSTGYRFPALPHFYGAIFQTPPPKEPEHQKTKNSYDDLRIPGSPFYEETIAYHIDVLNNKESSVQAIDNSMEYLSEFADPRAIETLIEFLDDERIVYDMDADVSSPLYLCAVSALKRFGLSAIEPLVDKVSYLSSDEIIFHLLQNLLIFPELQYLHSKKVVKVLESFLNYPDHEIQETAKEILHEIQRNS